MHALDAVGLLDFQFRTSFWRLGRRDADAFEVKVGIRPGQALHGDAAHLDLLHKLLVVGIYRIEPIHLVVLRLVRGGVAQDHQRVELRQLLCRGLALHLLRLIQNHDGAVLFDDVDRTARLKIIQLQIDAPGILAAGIERLHVDDHHVDSGIRRKALQIVKLLRVIDEVAGLLAVALQKVLRHDLEGLQHAFADGNARHHHDELAPPVVPVQFEHRLDVAVCLACARLHLDIEVHVADGSLLQLR